MFWLFTIAAVACLVGAGLLAIGLRGRRANDHPHCRGCGFDLIGLTEPRTCPECGADLSRRDAIKMGQRVRRSGVVWAACVLLACGLNGWIALKYQQSVGVNWNALKPDWVLVSQADGWLGRAEAGVLDELVMRGENRGLSSESLQTLARRALDIQADPKHAWLERWGDLFMIAHKQNAVTDAERERFLWGCCEDRVFARPRVRAGTQQVVMVGWSVPSPMPRLPTVRSGGKYGYTAGLVVRQSTFTAVRLMRDGVVVEVQKPHEGEFEWEPVTSMAGAFGYSWLWHVSPGEYTLHVEAKLTRGFEGASESDRGYSRTIQADIPVEITAPDEPTSITKVDRQMELSLARQLKMTYSIDEWYRSPVVGDPQIECTFDFMGGTSLAMCEVLVVDRDGPTMGQLHRSKSRVTMGLNYSPRITLPLTFREPIRARRIDVILMPSIEEAEAQVDVTEIWDGAVVFEDVALVDRDAARPVGPTRVISPAPKDVETLLSEIAGESKKE